MSNGGKGDSPRPMSVKYEDFANSFERIFGKKEKRKVWDGVECSCHLCVKEKNLVEREGSFLPMSSTRMILCPLCGNKRCPKASDHNLDCTNSNDTGQRGSVYERTNSRTDETGRN